MNKKTKWIIVCISVFALVCLSALIISIFQLKFQFNLINEAQETKCFNLGGKLVLASCHYNCDEGGREGVYCLLTNGTYVDLNLKELLNEK